MGAVGDPTASSTQNTSMVDCKTKAREKLDIAFTKEGTARKRLGMTEMMEFGAQLRLADIQAVNAAVAETKRAIEAFADECREETRVSIVAWIEAAPARMDAQKAAGAQPLHYMHEIGMRTAVTDIAKAIKNKADLEKT